MLLTLIVVIKHFDVFKCVHDYQIQICWRQKWLTFLAEPNQSCQPSTYDT